MRAADTVLACPGAKQHAQGNPPKRATSIPTAAWWHQRAGMLGDPALVLKKPGSGDEESDLRPIC